MCIRSAKREISKRSENLFTRPEQSGRNLNLFACQSACNLNFIYTLFGEAEPEQVQYSKCSKFYVDDPVF